MPGPQPSWQVEPCPPWCVREHDEDDIALDRYHQGEPSRLQVSMSTTPEEPREATFATVALTLRTGRYVGESVDWIAIEPVAPRMTLTAESARRLGQRLAQQLAQHSSAVRTDGADRAPGTDGTADTDGV